MLQAVIMAAGQSTRTHPLTLTKPKPLLHIANKPILAHQLDQFVGLTQEAIIIIGFKGNMIQEKFGDSYRGIALGYVEQQEQLGTGHAALQVRPYIHDRFVLINGDDLYAREDIEACLRYPYAILGKEIPDIRAFSELIVEGGIIKDIVEKPEDPVGNLTSVGMYVLDNRIFHFLETIPRSPRGEFELPDGITQLIKIADVHCHVVTGYWIPVGYPWHVVNANDFMLEQYFGEPVSEGVIEEGVKIDGKVSVGAHSVIRQGTYIQGNVCIGRNCEIGPNCSLSGNTSIGDHCHIEHGTTIQNSVIERQCRIEPFCNISHSVLADHVVAGTGTVTMSVPTETKTVTSVIKGDVVPSDRQQFGVTVGSHVTLQPHVVTYPGVKIGPDTIVAPGTVVKDDI